MPLSVSLRGVCASCAEALSLTAELNLSALRATRPREHSDTGASRVGESLFTWWLQKATGGWPGTAAGTAAGAMAQLRISTTLLP